MPARFFEENIKSALKNKTKLSAFLDALIAKHCLAVKKIQLQYIFCNDDYLLNINQQFLGHDTLTDIITFDLSEKNDELNGEIYISIERIKENMTQFKTPYQEELHRVIFHGTLHLCGFKDKTKTDKEEMRGMESRCLKQYFQ